MVLAGSRRAACASRNIDIATEFRSRDFHYEWLKKKEGMKEERGEKGLKRERGPLAIMRRSTAFLLLCKVQSLRSEFLTMRARAARSRRGTY